MGICSSCDTITALVKSRNNFHLGAFDSFVLSIEWLEVRMPKVVLSDVFLNAVLGLWNKGSKICVPTRNFLALF